MSNLKDEMKSRGLCVGCIHHDSGVYGQFIYTDEDDRVEVRDLTDSLLLTFTATCDIQHRGKTIGRIDIRDDHLAFKFDQHRKHTDYIPTKYRPLELDAYFKAEADATKYFLDNQKSILA